MAMTMILKMAQEYVTMCMSQIVKAHINSIEYIREQEERPYRKLRLRNWPYSF